MEVRHVPVMKCDVFLVSGDGRVFCATPVPVTFDRKNGRKFANRDAIMSKVLHSKASLEMMYVSDGKHVVGYGKLTQAIELTNPPGGEQLNMPPGSIEYNEVEL